MSTPIRAIFRWAPILAVALGASACNLLPQAVDSLRWTTPLDTKKETLTITDAVAGARKTASDEHKALQENDPAALKKAGEDAAKREEELREELKKRIGQLEDAQSGAIAAIGGIFPGAGQTLAAVLSSGFTTNKTSASSAETAAKDASKEVARVAESNKALEGKMDEVEKVVDQLDPATLAAMRKLDVARLQEIARGGNKDELVAAIKLQLADQLSPEKIEELVSKTNGMSVTEIMALIASALGGGALGTGGGRMLSRSGKRIDKAKQEIDELYDDVGKLRERNAQLEAKGGKCGCGGKHPEPPEKACGSA